MSRTRRRHMEPHEHRKARTPVVTRSRAIRDRAQHHAEQPKCHGSGKVGYARHQEAARALDVQRRLNLHEPAGSIYRCPECDDWHLSSWGPGEYKRARHGLDP